MNLEIGNIVVYNGYIGRVVAIDWKINIAYVYYGIMNVAAATEISQLDICENLNTAVNKELINFDFLETMFLDNAFNEKDESVYIASLHNIIKSFNEANYSVKINELDYLIQLNGDLNSFANTIRKLNLLTIKEEIKR